MIIRIKNLKLKAIVGIHEFERVESQPVSLNIELEFDGKRAAQTDQISETVDYDALSKKIISHVESSSYFLIEKLAQSVLDIVMSCPGVLQATVELDKPMAVPRAESTSVLVSSN